MNREELRRVIVDGLDTLHGRPLAWAFMSSEQRQVLLAQRDFWIKDDGTQLDRLLVLMQRHASDVGSPQEG